jgi:UDP:flavonoid glycosyltransferase YjiC (YdhE family)
LSKADAFITHAGFNSVNEALCFGVPMLALPQVNDQYMVAKRLASMQLGYAENMNELSAELLRTKTEALIANTLIKENCMKMAQNMKESARLEDVETTLINIIGARKGVK